MTLKLKTPSFSPQNMEEERELIASLNILMWQYRHRHWLIRECVLYTRVVSMALNKIRAWPSLILYIHLFIPSTVWSGVEVFIHGNEILLMHNILFVLRPNVYTMSSCQHETNRSILNLLCDAFFSLYAMLIFFFCFSLFILRIFSKLLHELPLSVWDHGTNPKTRSWTLKRSVLKIAKKYRFLSGELCGSVLTTWANHTFELD